jgi:hypothetical protein
LSEHAGHCAEMTARRPSRASRPGPARRPRSRVCRSRRRRGRRSRRVALRFARERKPIDAGRLQRAGRPANVRAAAPPRTRAPCSPQTRRLRWTGCDRSAPTPTDCCLRDRAVVSAITAAVLLLEESGHDVDAHTAGVRCPSPTTRPRKGAFAYLRELECRAPLADRSRLASRQLQVRAPSPGDVERREVPQIAGIAPRGFVRLRLMRDGFG